MPNATDIPTVTSSDGSRIAYQTAGDGPPLIMIDQAGGFHGLRPTAEVVPKLSQHFRVINYDRRGRGWSDERLPYSVEREVEDLAAVIEMTGAESHVFGFSSGAALAAHAAAAGLPINRLTLLEPAIELSRPPSAESDLGRQITDLVNQGRRGEAFMHFNRSTGVPEEFISGMPEDPIWPEIEALAHTLVYDLMITGTVSTDVLGSIDIPTIVIGSQGSDDQLIRFSEDVTRAIPAARLIRLPGGWHGVDHDLLAAEIIKHAGSAV